jgi:hypothetical protein
LNREIAPTNKVEKTDPQAKPQPIAAAFKPIPKLESYIGSQMRSGGFHIYVDEPKSGMPFCATPGNYFSDFLEK